MSDERNRELERAADCTDGWAAAALRCEINRAHVWDATSWTAPLFGEMVLADWRCTECGLSRDGWVAQQLACGDLAGLLPEHVCHPVFMTMRGKLRWCCREKQEPELRRRHPNLALSMRSWARPLTTDETAHALPGEGPVPTLGVPRRRRFGLRPTWWCVTLTPSIEDLR